jgi:DNA-binding NarL/FixJ family response regulator
VRAVHAGRRYLSEKLSPRALDDYIRERGPDHPIERLSRRELQVLKLIVEGHTSSQVAALLGLSPKSIDTYRSRMMNKLEINDLASLVKFAIRHGVTSLE